MRRLAETCKAIAGTTKKLEKIAIVADYFISRTAEEAAISAVSSPAARSLCIRRQLSKWVVHCYGRWYKSFLKKVRNSWPIPIESTGIWARLRARCSLTTKAHQR